MPSITDFSPFSLAANVENACLASLVISGRRPDSLGSLKECYGTAINVLQGSNLPFNSNSVLVTFDDELVINEMLREGLIASQDIDNEACLIPECERPYILAKITDALEYIRAVDDHLATLVENLIGVVPVLRVDAMGGGSMSTLTGLLWLSPDQDWTIIDYAEAIVHEYIHNSIFLADAVHNVFAYPLDFNLPDNHVVSAIRKEPRPYDKSYHSAVVAQGLHLFLGHANQHERSEGVVDGLEDTLVGLYGKQVCLAQYGRFILDSIQPTC